MKKKDQPPEDSTSWIDYIPVTITSLLFLSQIIVGLHLVPEVSQIQVLAYAGAGLYACSGLIFGFLPVFEFRRKGGGEKGKVTFTQQGLLIREYTRLFVTRST